MNSDFSEIFKNNPPEILDKLENIKIGIAGCGGLGSNIAMMLVRAGIKKFTIVDFDKVEMTNLNRQFYFQKDIGKPKIQALQANLQQINPEVNVICVEKKLNENDIYTVFEDCEIIVEAFDSVEAKTMITQVFQDEKFNNKYLVGGSGLAGMKTVNNIKTRRLANNIYICGDFFSESNENTGLLSSRVMVTAAHQANMVIRILSGNLNP